MMKKNYNVIASIFLALNLLLAGCAGSGAKREELPTSSDQSENQKRARIRLQLAVDYYQQHQLPVALDEIKKALAADPDFADAYSVRALVYMDMGEIQLADDNFQHAMKLSPNNPELSNNYGWFLCQNGRASQSIPYFELAFKNRAYRSPEKALNNAGVCMLRLKDHGAAEKYFLQAFQFDPGNPVTNVNLAKIFYDKRDYERAHFYMSRVLKADVIAADVLWLAIRIEHQLGDRSSEASLGVQLQRRYPDSPEFTAYQRGAFND